MFSVGRDGSDLPGLVFFRRPSNAVIQSPGRIEHLVLSRAPRTSEPLNQAPLPPSGPDASSEPPAKRPRVIRLSRFFAPKAAVAAAAAAPEADTPPSAAAAPTPPAAPVEGDICATASEADESPAAMPSLESPPPNSARRLLQWWPR